MKSKYAVSKEAKRLKDARTKLGIKQGEFCKILGLMQGSYSDIERGKSAVTITHIKILMTELGINPFWILTGHGYMIIPSLKDSSPDDNLVFEDADLYGDTTPELEKLRNENQMLTTQVKALESENSALSRLVNLLDKKG